MPNRELLLNETDKAIINLLQDDLPLTSRPFAGLALQLGIPEGSLLDRITELKAEGILTRFGPFFDAEAIGGAFCLCAMAVPEDQYNDVAEIVNDHVEVAHNYRREHQLNMWFVLAAQRPEEIGKTAMAIESKTGLTVLQFPKLREFYLRFKVAL